MFFSETEVISERLLRISSLYPLIFGCSAMTMTSNCNSLYPSFLTFSYANENSFLPAASLHSLVEGKFVPISPRFKAPSIESIKACNTISPSE